MVVEMEQCWTGSAYFFIYFFRFMDSDTAKIDAFLMNYPSALSRAIALDTKIVSDANNLSSAIGLPSGVATNLTDLIILSVRQTIGSLEFTTVRSSNGQLAGPDEWRIFMKDFGTTRCVSLHIVSSECDAVTSTQQTGKPS